MELAPSPLSWVAVFRAAAGSPGTSHARYEVRQREARLEQVVLHAQLSRHRHVPPASAAPLSTNPLSNSFPVAFTGSSRSPHSRTITIVPRPGAESIVISPPCASTMPLQIAIPSPVPDTSRPPPPPAFRANASPSRSTISGEIPDPVSLTRSCTHRRV